MYFEEIRDIYMKNGEFFDFMLEGIIPPIIDYSFLDREIIVVSKDTTKKEFNIEFGDIKIKKGIETIDDLRLIFKELVLHAKELFRQYAYDVFTLISDDFEHSLLNEVSQNMNDHYNIKEEDMELITNQLILDILYQKYIIDYYEDEIDLDEYCKNYFYHYDKNDDKWKKPTEDEFEDNKDDAKKKAKWIMERQIDLDIKVMETEKAVVEYEKFKLECDERISRFSTNPKMTKSTWDTIFLKRNRNLITTSQYRRNFVIESAGDDVRFALNLDNYDKYIETVMKERRFNDKDEDYFYKFMRFYESESIFRVDFIYKLAKRLESGDSLNEDKSPFLVADFYPTVSCPYIAQHEGSMNLAFEKNCNVYLPITLGKKSCDTVLEKKIKKPDKDPDNNSDKKSEIDSLYELDLLFGYSLINIYRAKALELFSYHYVFIPDNYEELSDFLRKNYAIELCHERNKIWNDVKELVKEEQKTRGKKTVTLTPEQKKLLEIFQALNKKFLPEIDTMNRKNWRKKSIPNIANSTTQIEDAEHVKIDEERIKTLKTDEEYLSLFGIDKGTFEKNLSVLENAYLKSHTSGGRPARLSVLDKFIVMIERERNKRTLENIALDYDVSKSQISNANEWVKETLKNNKISIVEILNNGRE